MSHLATVSSGTNTVEVNLGDTGRGRNQSTGVVPALTSLPAVKQFPFDSRVLECLNPTVQDTIKAVLVVHSFIS